MERYRPRWYAGDDGEEGVADVNLPSTIIHEELGTDIQIVVVSMSSVT